jgi:hypothetical protein
MMKTSITPADVVAVLNRALAADKDALTHLFTDYTVCNATLASDPTIQCSQNGQQFRVRPLGILNGIFGIFDDGPKKGYGPIYMVVNDDGSIKEFSLIENFKVS